MIPIFADGCSSFLIFFCVACVGIVILRGIWRMWLASNRPEVYRQMLVNEAQQRLHRQYQQQQEDAQKRHLEMLEKQRLTDRNSKILGIGGNILLRILLGGR